MNIKRKGLKEILGPGSPIFAVAVALLTLAAGVAASLWNENIKASTRLTIDPSEMDAKATAFWFVVLVWFLFFWLRQRAEHKALLMMQRDAKLTAEAVLALPPKTFFDNYSAHICNLKIFPSSSNTSNKEEKERSIRDLLKIITNLARSYDARPFARYATNVMIYIEKEDIKSENTQTKKFEDFDFESDVKRFLSDDFSKEKIQGLLYLPKQLSVANNSSEIDPCVEDNFVLPILTEAITTEHVWRILPGAPVSFFKWNNFISLPARIQLVIQEIEANIDEEKRLLANLLKIKNQKNTNSNSIHDKEIVQLKKHISDLKKELAARKATANKILEIATPPELRNAAHGMDSIQNINNLMEKNTSLQTFIIDGDKYQFGENTTEKIKKYYGNGGRGNNVKSFLSLPLVLNDGTLQAFGTLNIHCDSPTFLGAPADDALRRRATFASVISSLVFDVAESVNEWQKLTTPQDIASAAPDCTSQ